MNLNSSLLYEVGYTCGQFTKGSILLVMLKNKNCQDLVTSR